MQAKNYQDYTVASFIEDDDFIRYVKHQQAVDVLFWDEVLAKHPYKKQDFKTAANQLGVILSAQPLTVPANLTESLWNDIESSIQKNKRKSQIIKLRNIWLSGAAACLALFGYGSWYFYSDITISTKYGEQKVLLLPDGSKVRLNANSSITYARAFNWNDKRKVNVAGEAYFEVKHINQNPAEIKDGERFIAQSKALTVEVLGTTFNLKARPNLNQVALIAGKVSVKAVGSNASRVLKPGELAILNANKTFEVDQKAALAPQVAWTEHKLLMSQTRVGDIIAEFENLYGYQIILPDTAMANKRIDGTISTASEESMLFVIKNILNVNVRQQGKTIYLEKR
jgi:ferric-dicitrate binding protein FerR (iron transport regulator)